MDIIYSFTGISVVILVITICILDLPKSNITCFLDNEKFLEHFNIFLTYIPLLLCILNMYIGTSLVVQWLRLHTPNAGSLGSIPGQGTRFHMPQLRARMPQLRSPGAPTKTWCNQINKERKENQCNTPY